MLRTQLATTAAKHLAPYLGSSNHVYWLSQSQPSRQVDWFVSNSHKIYAVSRRDTADYWSATLAWAWVSLEAQSQRKTVFLGSLNDPRLLLRQPLTITVYSTPETVAAYCFDLDELAVGDTEDAALEDMRVSIVDSYFILKDHQTKLGRLQQAHWNFLRSITQERAT